MVQYYLVGWYNWNNRKVQFNWLLCCGHKTKFISITHIDGGLLKALIVSVQF